MALRAVVRQHRAPARPPVAPNARIPWLSSVNYFFSRQSEYSRNYQTSFLPFLNLSTYQLFNVSTIQLFNCSPWVPPQQCMVLQLLCQGGHPGEGSAEDGVSWPRPGEILLPQNFIIPDGILVASLHERTPPPQGLPVCSRLRAPKLFCHWNVYVRCPSRFLSDAQTPRPI